MNRLLIAALAFVLWSVGVFVVGWQVRDGSADTQATGASLAASQQQTHQVTQARATDHTNAQASASVESKRVADASKLANDFRDIDESIRTYAQHPKSNPDSACARGSADAEFVRIWNAASAGRSPDAGPGHRPGADAGSDDRRPAADAGGRRVDPRESCGHVEAGACSSAPGERPGVFPVVAGGLHGQWHDTDAAFLVRDAGGQGAPVMRRKSLIHGCGCPVDNGPKSCG